MAVYSSLNVQGTEFISLTGDPLPACLNATEPHVVGSGTVMRPAVVKQEGAWTVYTTPLCDHDWVNGTSCSIDPATFPSVT